MATTNIELDIENITGVSDADDQFIKTAQKFVVSSIPKNLMLWAGTSTASATHGGDDSPEAVTLPQPTDNIIDVVRNGFSAEQVPESMQGFIKNSNSLHQATATYPKYFIQAGNKVIVKPNPSDSETALVNYVDFLKVDDDCDLRGAVVYHACAQEFEKLASAKADISVSFTTTPPIYLSPTMEDKTAFSAYTSGLSETDPGVFSITAVSPSSPVNPSISSPGVGTTGKPDIAGNAPAYTKPIFTGAGSFYLTEMEAGTIGDAASDIDAEHWFSIAGQLIEDEEDTELATAHLQKINTFISAYQTDMQNELNEFNKENAIYQANIQAEIAKHQTDAQEAQKEGDLTLQASIQDYTLELQKYGADVGKYQAEVNTQVQEYSQKLAQYQAELQISVQTWQQVESEKITRFQAQVQDAMNKFNKDTTEYQAQLQVSVQNTQLKSADATHYANESKKYYEWAVTEINMYVQNNSKMISTTMAAQAAAQRQRA